MLEALMTERKRRLAAKTAAAKEQPKPDEAGSTAPGAGKGAK